MGILGLDNRTPNLPCLSETNIYRAGHVAHLTLNSQAAIAGAGKASLLQRRKQAKGKEVTSLEWQGQSYAETRIY